MPKLTKKAIGHIDVRTDPNYRKSLLLKKLCENKIVYQSL